jgi:hypothetical protein
MSTKKPMQVVAPDPNAKPSPSKYVGGSIYQKFNELLCNQAINSLWLDHSDEATRQKQLEAALEAMAGIGPRDETEGMLAAQMVACHAGAMDCFRRAMLPNQTFEGRQQNLNFGNKLSRTYALHMEALDKHRGKGQQRVVVEHVHIHKGGQAIVGNVNPGVGVSANSETQAHGKAIADAREPEMRSTFEAEGETLPVTSNEEL